MTSNNPNLDMVKIIANTKLSQFPLTRYQDIKRKRNSESSHGQNSVTKFGEIMSICYKDIERKRNSDINQGP